MCLITPAMSATYQYNSDLKCSLRKMEHTQWKQIQERTFTKYVNSQLRKSDTSIENLETGFSDGLKLINLISVLSGKEIRKFSKKPTFRTQKLENVSIALKFLESEGVTLVNIDSSDVVDCRIKLVMSLVWALILHYSSVAITHNNNNHGGEEINKQPEQHQATPVESPKKKLLGWMKQKLGGLDVGNFTSDWVDGKRLGALVNGVAPGLCPDWSSWRSDEQLRNTSEAMELADKWLGVSKLISPEEMVNSQVDELSMITYLSQYPNARLKERDPLKETKEIINAKHSDQKSSSEQSFKSELSEPGTNSISELKEGILNDLNKLRNSKHIETIADTNKQYSGFKHNVANKDIDKNKKEYSENVIEIRNRENKKVNVSISKAFMCLSEDNKSCSEDVNSSKDSSECLPIILYGSEIHSVKEEITILADSKSICLNLRDRNGKQGYDEREVKNEIENCENMGVASEPVWQLSERLEPFKMELLSIKSKYESLIEYFKCFTKMFNLEPNMSCGRSLYVKRIRDVMGFGWLSYEIIRMIT